MWVTPSGPGASRSRPAEKRSSRPASRAPGDPAGLRAPARPPNKGPSQTSSSPEELADGLTTRGRLKEAPGRTALRRHLCGGWGTRAGWESTPPSHDTCFGRSPRPALPEDPCRPGFPCGQPEGSVWSYSGTSRPGESRARRFRPSSVQWGRGTSGLIPTFPVNWRDRDERGRLFTALLRLRGRTSPGRPRVITPGSRLSRPVDGRTEAPRSPRDEDVVCLYQTQHWDSDWSTHQGVVQSGREFVLCVRTPERQGPNPLLTLVRFVPSSRRPPWGSPLHRKQQTILFHRDRPSKIDRSVPKSEAETPHRLLVKNWSFPSYHFRGLLTSKTSEPVDRWELQGPTQTQTPPRRVAINSSETRPGPLLGVS